MHPANSESNIALFDRLPAIEDTNTNSNGDRHTPVLRDDTNKMFVLDQRASLRSKVGVSSSK